MVNKIIVLDFGSQYNQLICRRIREKGVYSELLPYDIELDKLKGDDVKGIILSGGPNSVYDDKSFNIDEKIFSLGKPILGICYGMQLIAYKLHGTVSKADKKEYGKTMIEVNNTSLLFDSIEIHQQVFMSHGDYVSKVPNGFSIIGKSENCSCVAFENYHKQIYGIQFHPEVRHTINGTKILENFIFKVCHCDNNWSMDEFISSKIKEIKETVKNEKVICGLSGGVDSSVVASLLSKAIGKNLTCIFVDHGLLRKNEVAEVSEVFTHNFDMNLIVIDAKQRFLDKLSGISDPEMKRKIIGKEFIDVFQEEANKINNVKYLAQGTLYTDIIESGTKTAQTIKSHHNVGGLPKDMKFKLIEPLNTLFKDEVREVGLKLGLSEKIVMRQPFPGPGLAIRILGEITEDKLRIVRESDAILQEEIRKASLHKEIWQYFTVLTGIKSVGVMGDQRSYDYTIAIRAVTSIDGMTANFAHIPYDVLEIISTRIVNEINGVNRVVMDITSKPPATIEWE